MIDYQKERIAIHYAEANGLLVEHEIKARELSVNPCIKINCNQINQLEQIGSERLLKAVKESLAGGSIVLHNYVPTKAIPESVLTISGKRDTEE